MKINRSKFSAFILAAGLGERLRPITNYIPKPLIPILGKPVLQAVLEKVSPVTDKIGANLHYEKGLIEDWIRQSAFGQIVNLFPEDPVLGTGGALKNAGDFLKDSPFLVHNSDILSDIDLPKLIDCHLSSENLATLAVHDYPAFNKLILDEKGFFKDVRKTASGAGPLAFTGIAVYSPDFLKLLPPGISSVVDVWLKAVAMGYKIGTLDVSGCYWTDIGTPASYAKAVVNDLREKGEIVYIHPSVTGCESGEIDGNVVIEKGCALHGKVYLRNCIVLPRTEIGEKDRDETVPECLLSPFRDKGWTGGRSYENCLLGPGFGIDIDESDVFNLTENDDVLIGMGGSDRKYYRVKRDSGSAVLMKCTDTDPDFERHIEYTHFFRKYIIPVPQLIDADFDSKSALFEDIGDLSLYSWLKCPHAANRIGEIYEKVITIVVLIHTTATAHIAECPLLRNRIFDYGHLRWETEYFLERFVQDAGNLRLKCPSGLSAEFHRLALKVDSFPKTIMHRDFQSQNIMITKGWIPRLLDFQGARIGPPAYDVASILWDPYYRLEDDLRGRLIDHYIAKMKSAVSSFSEADFMASLLPCRLQRHMQALGAYGFLSAVKGKKYFLKYIPEGLRLLKEDMALAKKEYPALNGLVKRL